MQDDLVKLLKEVSVLKERTDSLCNNLVTLNKEEFSLILQESLKDLFRDEEKIKLLRNLRLLLILFGSIGLTLAMSIIGLILFTEPI